MKRVKKTRITKKFKSNAAIGTVLSVKEIGEFDHEVIFQLSDGKTISFTKVWERLPEVGDVAPAEVIQVFERLVSKSCAVVEA